MADNSQNALQPLIAFSFNNKGAALCMSDEVPNVRCLQPQCSQRTEWHKMSYTWVMYDALQLQDAWIEGAAQNGCKPLRAGFLLQSRGLQATCRSCRWGNFCLYMDYRQGCIQLRSPMQAGSGYWRSLQQEMIAYLSFKQMKVEHIEVSRQSISRLTTNPLSSFAFACKNLTCRRLNRH